MNKRIHIVCLDAPSPPDYGGVFDLFYKIPALHALGWKIVLHYFQYKQGRNATGLEKYCESIFSYPRRSFLSTLLKQNPYIVTSRVNDALIHRINQDHAPVLLEGIHCTGILPYLKPDKKIIVRIHNDEAVYYEHLYQTESAGPRKWYYGLEYRKLISYQKRLHKNLTYCFVSQTDAVRFADLYQMLETHFIPCFLPWQKVQSLPGKGTYCLYHGNLNVSENHTAASWLQEAVFSRTTTPLVIAGRGANLIDNGHIPAHVKLIDNPTDTELSDLITHAHIHLLPSFNATGVKLKLLHALFEGRFCVTNKNGLAGSGLPNGSVIQAETADEMLNTIKGLMQRPFLVNDQEQRSRDVELYNNNKNAALLNDLM